MLASIILMKCFINFYSYAVSARKSLSAVLIASQDRTAKGNPGSKDVTMFCVPSSAAKLILRTAESNSQQQMSGVSVGLTQYPGSRLNFP